MATEEQIRRAIKAIAQGPRSVRFEQIEWVMNHLPDIGIPVRKTGQNQHYTYTVGDLTSFQVVDHHKGQSQVKKCYVNQFLARMIDLDLFD